MTNIDKKELKKVLHYVYLLDDGFPGYSIQEMVDEANDFLGINDVEEIKKLATILYVVTGSFVESLTRGWQFMKPAMEDCLCNDFIDRAQTILNRGELRIEDLELYPAEPVEC